MDNVSESRTGDGRRTVEDIRAAKAVFVMSTDVPLQLIKEEQRLRARIAELEARESRLSEGATYLPGALHLRRRWSTPHYGGVLL